MDFSRQAKSALRAEKISDCYRSGAICVFGDCQGMYADYKEMEKTPGSYKKLDFHRDKAKEGSEVAISRICEDTTQDHSYIARPQGSSCALVLIREQHFTSVES